MRWEEPKGRLPGIGELGLFATKALFPLIGETRHEETQSRRAGKPSRPPIRNNVLVRYSDMRYVRGRIFRR